MKEAYTSRSSSLALIGGDKGIISGCRWRPGGGELGWPRHVLLPVGRRWLRAPWPQPPTRV